jgi:DNA sulfur modification protein DndC
VAGFIGASGTTSDVVVSLGMRKNESEQRNRSLVESGNGNWQMQREGRGQYRLYLPILDLNIAEVWDAVFMLDEPASVDATILERLYKDASGECPVIKAPNAQPCASGRFGCWTCTVVRKDKSSKKLIEAGYDNLRPFLQFRDWLAHVRNDPKRRWPQRRNGRAGLGPFTLEARKEILSELRKVEVATGTSQVSPDEWAEIQKLWRLDEALEVEP